MGHTWLPADFRTAVENAKGIKAQLRTTKLELMTLRFINKKRDPKSYLDAEIRAYTDELKKLWGVASTAVIDWRQNVHGPVHDVIKVHIPLGAPTVEKGVGKGAKGGKGKAVGTAGEKTKAQQEKPELGGS